MVRPWHEMLKASTDACLEWTEEGRSAFRSLKQALLKALALALPNLEKPFEPFAREKRGIALGVLTQLLEPLCRAAVYFSKQLDTVSQGWPGCLKTAAGTVILIQESWKFYPGTEDYSRCTTHGDYSIGTQRGTLVGPKPNDKVSSGPVWTKMIHSSKLPQY